MIQFNMNSKGPINRDNLTSINQTNSKNMVSAQNITSINTASSQLQGNNPPISERFVQQSVQQSVPRPIAQPVQQSVPQPIAQSVQQSVPQPIAQPVQQSVPQPMAQPIQRPIPILLNQVQKGQKISLNIATSPARINACFGWNVKNSLCDVDVSAFLLGENGKVIGDSWFVFYGQDTSPDQSIQFISSTPKDCQMFKLDFNKLDSNVKKIVFVLTINDAFEKNLHFEMIQDAYIRIMDSSNTNELVSFKMSDYYSNVISMMIGEIYQHNGTWKFNAIGNGVAKDLAGLCELYGVVVQ